MSLEKQLQHWAKKPSDTEDQRIANTERLVKAALGKSDDPRVSAAHVFTKGSVKVRTNITKDSDIDLCIQANGVFFTDYPTGKSDADYGNSGAGYSFSEFRRKVEDALVDAFGADVDISGNKAIRVNGTVSGSRIDADVVPAFEHRRYRSEKPNLGIEIRSKSNMAERIVNWPHHNYSNSVDKHQNTYKRYKKLVRIFKHAREAMKENGITSHDSQSFLIESLLWNVPSHHYGGASLTADVVSVLGYLKNQLSSSISVSEWGEVNELKYLFRTNQKWTREGALAFINNTDSFLGSLQ